MTLVNLAPGGVVGARAAAAPGWPAALRPARLLPAQGDPVEADATRVLAEGFAHLVRASVAGNVIWWMWFVAGVGLLIFELVTPGGFFAIFFGVAALLVGVLTVLHLASPEWLQWLLFSVFSVLGVVVLRRPVMQRLGLPTAALPGEEMRGEWALVTEEVRPGEVGKVELRGTAWSARANRTVRVGERVPVERIEGLTVWLAGTEGRGGWAPGGGST